MRFHDGQVLRRVPRLRIVYHMTPTLPRLEQPSQAPRCGPLAGSRRLSHALARSRTLSLAIEDHYSPPTKKQTGQTDTIRSNPQLPRGTFVGCSACPLIARPAFPPCLHLRPVCNSALPSRVAWLVIAHVCVGVCPADENGKTKNPSDYTTYILKKLPEGQATMYGHVWGTTCTSCIIRHRSSPNRTPNSLSTTSPLSAPLLHFYRLDIPGSDLPFLTCPWAVCRVPGVAVCRCGVRVRYDEFEGQKVPYSSRVSFMKEDDT